MREKLPWMIEAEEKMKTPLTYHTSDQATGPCPMCDRLDGDGGEDRLVCFEDGGWFCRGCKRQQETNPNRKYTGWWSNDNRTPERVEERKREKLERTKEAYSRMHTCQDWIAYSQAVNSDQALMFHWLEQGLQENTVLRWGLGYCTETPCDEQKRPSLTIPVFFQGKLFDIRHRIIGAEGNEKYRSHLPGVVPIYFNLDGIKGGQQVYVVEGEKKAMVLMQEGFSPCLAYPGINFIQYLAPLLKREGSKDQEFILLPDPGSVMKVEQAVYPLRREGYICSIVDPIEKPDDMVLEYGPSSLKAAVDLRRRL